MTEIVCPSGLTGRIRTLKTGDLAVFTDKRLFRRPGPSIDAALLDRVWRETIETGPYAFDGKPPWMREVLQGDLFFALKETRILSWGDEYEFDAPCRRSSCPGIIRWTVNLSDLPTKILSESAREIVANGNRFEATLSNGTRIAYSLPCGTTGVRAEKWAREHGEGLHVVYASRLKEVEGVDSPSQFPAWVADLDVRLGEELAEELDRHNCGVETGIDVDCPECGFDQSIDVPFGADFFIPDRSKRRKP